MQRFIKFPSIRQYKDVEKSVHKVNKPKFSHLTDDKKPVFVDNKPTLDFYGTVKLHGSNGGAMIWSDGKVTAQSRKRMLAIGDDNAAFAAFVAMNREWFKTNFTKHLPSENSCVAVYGEWVGEGIQDKVAISNLPRTFVIFAVAVHDFDTDTVRWFEYGELIMIDSDRQPRIYKSLDFQTYYVRINFNDTQSDLDLIGRLRDEVDKSCPVAKALGVEGIGEGIVFKCLTPNYKSSKFTFKIKGESHKRGDGTKTKIPKHVKPLTPEQEQARNEFLELACEQDRLHQGIEHLNEMGIPLSKASTGKYLQWFVGDVRKECELAIEACARVGLSWKFDMNMPSQQIAREFFFEHIDNI